MVGLTDKPYQDLATVLCVGIHEHCTVAKIRFSHPNIAEVVYVKVTPIDGNKLDKCFSKLVLNLDLRWSL